MSEFFKKILLNFFVWIGVTPVENSSFVPVVVDLDRMLSTSVGIRFRGRIHKINPMTLETFLKTINEIARLDALRKKENVPVKEVRDGYYRVFDKCSDTLGSAAKDMNDAQIAAVLRQVVECVTGKAYAQNDQKKNSMIPKLQSA